jgi:acyl carrier protein
MKKTKEDLNKIFKSVFKIKNDSTLEKLDAKTFKKWDSVSHVNLIIALESKFKISIDDREIINLISYNKILKFIQRRNK